MVLQGRRLGRRHVPVRRFGTGALAELRDHAGPETPAKGLGLGLALALGVPAKLDAGVRTLLARQPRGL